MNEVESKKSPTKWIVIGVVIGIVVVASSILLFNSLSNIINTPNPEITSSNKYGGFQGFYYVCYVNVTVRNNGGDGWIKVFAEIHGGIMIADKDERVHLARGESRQLTFAFDITFWVPFSSITHRAWAVTD